MDIRCLVLAADRLADVDIFLRGKRSLRQVQLLLPLVAEGQFPGLEQDARASIGEDLGWVETTISASQTQNGRLWGRRDDVFPPQFCLISARLPILGSASFLDLAVRGRWASSSGFGVCGHLEWREGARGSGNLE